MLLFLIAATRAIVEMLLLCLLGQLVLYVLAGHSRERNPVYRLLAIITRPAMALCQRRLPSTLSGGGVAMVTFLCLLCLWFGLAILKKSI